MHVHKAHKLHQRHTLYPRFTYLVFTWLPGESYHRRLRSLLLYWCYVFQVLINSLVCWFCMSTLGLVLFQVCMSWSYVPVRGEEERMWTWKPKLAGTCTPVANKMLHSFLDSVMILSLSAQGIDERMINIHYYYYYSHYKLEMSPNDIQIELSALGSLYVRLGKWKTVIMIMMIITERWVLCLALCK